MTVIPPAPSLPITTMAISPGAANVMKFYATTEMAVTMNATSLPVTPAPSVPVLALLSGNDDIDIDPGLVSCRL